MTISACRNGGTHASSSPPSLLPPENDSALKSESSHSDFCDDVVIAQDEDGRTRGCNCCLLPPFLPSFLRCEAEVHTTSRCVCRRNGTLQELPHMNTTPEWVPLFISSQILDCAARIVSHMDLGIPEVAHCHCSWSGNLQAASVSGAVQRQYVRWHDVHCCWPLALHVESLGQALEW